MKASRRRCISCRERAVAPTVLPTYTTELEHDGRSYTVSVKNLPVLQCENCKAIVLGDDANTAISAALRREAGLLSPEEIRANRERLGLTQKQLAQYLRISESTLSRWSTGAQIQQRAMDALLRVFFLSAEARLILAGPVGATSCPADSYHHSMITQVGTKALNFSPATSSSTAVLDAAFSRERISGPRTSHLELVA